MYSVSNVFCTAFAKSITPSKAPLVLIQLWTA